MPSSTSNTSKQAKFPRFQPIYQEARDINTDIIPDCLREFKLLDLIAASDTEDLKIDNFDAIGSYCISSSLRPTIVVPGDSNFELYTESESLNVVNV